MLWPSAPGCTRGFLLRQSGNTPAGAVAETGTHTRYKGLIYWRFARGNTDTKVFFCKLKTPPIYRDHHSGKNKTQSPFMVFGSMNMLVRAFLAVCVEKMHINQLEDAGHAGGHRWLCWYTSWNCLKHHLRDETELLSHCTGLVTVVRVQSCVAVPYSLWWKSSVKLCGPDLFCIYCQLQCNLE